MCDNNNTTGTRYDYQELQCNYNNISLETKSTNSEEWCKLTSEVKLSPDEQLQLVIPLNDFGFYITNFHFIIIDFRKLKNKAEVTKLNLDKIWNVMHVYRSYFFDDIIEIVYNDNMKLKKIHYLIPFSNIGIYLLTYMKSIREKIVTNYSNIVGIYPIE